MDQQLWKRRWRRALLVAAVLRFVPYVRLIGLNGSMATGRMHAGSDIDFFIAIKHGHIFTGRLLSILVVTLLGVRTTDHAVAGKVCLNRFASDSFLDITPHNQYHADVFHNLIPLAASGDCYDRYRAANAWMADFDQPTVTHAVALRETWSVRLVRGTLEWCLDRFIGLENRLRRAQEVRIAGNGRIQQPGSQVIISEYEVRYHFAK